MGIKYCETCDNVEAKYKFMNELYCEKCLNLVYHDNAKEIAVHFAEEYVEEIVEENQREVNALLEIEVLK